MYNWPRNESPPLFYKIIIRSIISNWSDLAGARVQAQRIKGRIYLICKGQQGACSGEEILYLELLHGFQALPAGAVAAQLPVKGLQGDQHALAVLAVELPVRKVYQRGRLQRVVVRPALWTAVLQHWLAAGESDQPIKLMHASHVSASQHLETDH